MQEVFKGKKVINKFFLLFLVAVFVFNIMPKGVYANGNGVNDFTMKISRDGSVDATFSVASKTLTISGTGTIDFNLWKEMANKFNASFGNGSDHGWKNYDKNSLARIVVAENANINLCDTDNSNGLFEWFAGDIKFIGNVDTVGVTSFSRMFMYANNFNEDISRWNTSSVTDMQYMFCYASAFNRNIGSWDTSNVTDMSYMFSDASSFNQDIGNWKTSKVTNMHGMFSSASKFNRDISKWDTSKVTNMISMFAYAHAMKDIQLTNRGDANDTRARLIFNTLLPDRMKFKGLEAFDWFNREDDAYTVKNITAGGKQSYINGNGRFRFNANDEYEVVKGKLPIENQLDKSQFPFILNDQVSVIATYDERKKELKISGKGAVDMEKWIALAKLFNPNAFREEVNNYTNNEDSGWGGLANYAKNLQKISFSEGCDVILADTDVKKGGMFENFGGDIEFSGKVDVKGLTNLNKMFYKAKKFNENISAWDTSTVTDMSDMFARAEAFNQNIGDWNTDNVQNMRGMFHGAKIFNQDISRWNTAKVTNMSNMFRLAQNFNQDIGGWNTGKVVTMESMFLCATAFNQDIGGWNTENVKTMSFMFYKAANFNQDISRWNTANVTGMSVMFSETQAFNQDISNWNTAKVERMSQMFYNAVAMKNIVLTNRGNAVNTEVQDIIADNGQSFDQFKFKGLNAWEWIAGGKYMVVDVVDGSNQVLNPGDAYNFAANKEYHIIKIREKIIPDTETDKLDDAYVRITFYAADGGKVDDKDVKAIDVLKGTLWNDEDLLNVIDAIKITHPDVSKVFVNWAPAFPDKDTEVETKDFVTIFKDKTAPNPNPNPNPNPDPGIKPKPGDDSGIFLPTNPGYAMPNESGKILKDTKRDANLPKTGETSTYRFEILILIGLIGMLMLTDKVRRYSERK